MQKLFTVLTLVMLLSTGLTPAALADAHGPTYGCPDRFELHPAMDHDQDHQHPHQHIGSDEDRNGDGYICVKHLKDDRHVHIDNNVPLKNN